MSVAVVGMGYWGKNLVRNFSELDALSVICDEASDRESIVRETYPDTRFVADYKAVLADDAIQAVALATPAAMHF